MGKLVSNSFSLPTLPLSISAAPEPSLPNAGREEAAAHGFAEWFMVGEARGGGEVILGEKEEERRPSMGGGERARWVSGEVSW